MSGQSRRLSHLRSKAQRAASFDRSLSCPLCAAEIQPDIDAFRAHVRANEPKHSILSENADIEEAFRKMTIQTPKQRSLISSSKPAALNSSQGPCKRSGSKHLNVKDRTASRPKQLQQQSQPAQQKASIDASASSVGNRKEASSPSTLLQQNPSLPITPEPSPHRSGIASDFDRGEASKNLARRQLWSPADDSKIWGSRTRPSTRRRLTPGNKPPSVDDHDHVSVQPADLTTLPDFTVYRQPEIRPINQDQLVAELKGIYEALRLVENKCIELDDPAKSSISVNQQLSLEQYQKLIGLHRTLLHEHHDFFLASQHPAAGRLLRGLPAKYGMPARMWRHGIQSFLEFLRKRLPASLEHMLTFICLAYSIMTLLYETVHDYVDTWIECLGDLGRYRMAIQDVDIEDREIWTSVSRYWYSKASCSQPIIGRLYHHLAILARPDALQQLYYYSKSLCVPEAFPSARGSIMTLFDPVLKSKSVGLDICDAAFIKVQYVFFSAKRRDQLQSSVEVFFGSIDGRIAEMKKQWLHPGFYIGISLICSMLGYGAKENPLIRALESSTTGALASAPAGDVCIRTKATTVNAETAEWAFDKATSFAMQSCNVMMQRKSDVNILPFLHTMMVFLYHVAQHPKAISLFEKKVPWKRTAELLNELRTALMSAPRMEEDYPHPAPKELPRPLPEDYAIRGLLLSRDYFPKDWFLLSDEDEDDEKMFEPPSLADERRQRVLWLGRRLGSLGKWIHWDQGKAEFTVDSAFDNDLDLSDGFG